MRHRVMHALAVAFLATAAPTVVHAQAAQPDAVAIEEARIHFEAGEVLLDAGKYDQAIVEFEASYALAKRPSALFMLATTYRRRWETQGKLADAKQARQIYDNFIVADPAHARVPYAREQIASLDRQIADAEKAESMGASAVDAAGSPEYRKALGLLAEGRFKEALVEAEAARHVAGTIPAELVRIWLVTGRAHALAGQSDEAILAFQRALSIDPDLDVALDMDAADGQAFARAQQGLRGKAPLAISAEAPLATRAGHGVAMKVNVDSDPLKIVVTVGLRYRTSDGESFNEISGRAGQPMDLPAAVLPERVESYKIFYYAVGYDDAGAIAAVWASPREPSQVEVLTRKEYSRRFVPAAPIYKKWWFWTGAAAVAAIGGTALYLTLSPELGEGPSLDLPVGLFVHF